MRSKQKSRRGSVLVLVAFMLAALMGVAAIAADIGRFYVVTGELQTVADAAALKGAATLQFATQNFESTVDADVIQWARTTNRSDGDSVVIAADSIDTGYWDPNARTFTTPSPVGLRPNAVSVKASGAPRGVFAQLIGRTSGLPLTRRGIAWVANISLDCTRPWALQYRPLVQAVNGNSDTTQALDMTKFLAYQQNLTEAQRTMVIHNEEVENYTPPPDDGVWNAYNLPSGPNGGANSGQTTYEGQIVNCNKIAMNSDAGNGNLQPSTGVGGCGAGTIVCWANGVIEGQTTGPAGSQGPGICVLNPGDATCYASDGTAGVTIDIAFANKVGNGAGAIDFKYVGEVKLLCYFKVETNLCNAIPNPRQKTNYAQGTLVVAPSGLKSRTLNPTDLISNAPSNVQRLLLVK
jgi:hypothetical protein